MRNILLILIVSFSTVICKAQCDKTLWKHVYNPSRLQVKDSCKTITGHVKEVIQEADGDYHIKLLADTLKGVSTTNGLITVEIICACKVTQKDAISACYGYSNTILKPTTNQHIKVTGAYCYDTIHKWYEFHPITSIVLIK